MKPFDIARILAPHLNDLGIRYMIGGSVASAYHGVPRTTLDLDLVIEADESQVRAFAARIEAEFYVDAEDAVDVVTHGGSFNLIHYGTSTKVDIFAVERREALDRRVSIEVGGAVLSMYSAEDIVAQKLHWFRLGGETSERQWHDVVGVLRMRKGDLDEPYLDRAADAFGVRDLLDLARQDALN
ncbi:MAG TPA: nucleotidyl transferase AbiEii/AbiGii toxin family protein [Thermoanaerobaculia bacterium]|nr:nucleotidyl transferase AbiEii/AbiGii toxin family protein [Thermoanaerobaculia bacterium]